jgi:alpha-N-acetylglucosaminidase
MWHKKIACFFIVLCCICFHQMLFAQLNVEASYALIKKTIPQHAASFVIEPLQAQNSKDVFEIESKSNKIILRGTNGVAIASALYFYLKEYCHCLVTWNGTNLNVPKQLPVFKEKIHKKTPYRYYLNY